MLKLLWASKEFYGGRTKIPKGRDSSALRHARKFVQHYIGTTVPTNRAFISVRLYTRTRARLAKIVKKLDMLRKTVQFHFSRITRQLPTTRLLTHISRRSAKFWRGGFIAIVTICTVVEANNFFERRWNFESLCYEMLNNVVIVNRRECRCLIIHGAIHLVYCQCLRNSKHQCWNK